MPKPQARYACQQCGAVAPKWAGRCEACGAWNSLIEEVPRAAPPKSLAQGGSRRGGHALDFVALRGDSAGPPRRLTGIAELDRVCGGGLVPGSTILVGGDPGIGKSTLLLQAAAALAASGGGAAAYITGEEAIDQIRLRAERLGVAGSPVGLAAASSVRDIVAALDMADAPDLVIIDSIQTMYLDTLDSAPGTVSQVRGAAQELIGLAKRRGFVVVLVGHVTKEGLIAGPRVAVVGWDATRLAMIMAVLDTRCGLSVGANDIYLNIAGGLRIVEPAADLAVAAALVSALTETPVPADTVIFGEIGLSGRVRPVAHTDARLKEAAKLGFAEAWVPAGRVARAGEGMATGG